MVLIKLTLPIHSIELSKFLRGNLILLSHMRFDYLPLHNLVGDGYSDSLKSPGLNMVFHPCRQYCLWYRRGSK